MVCLSPLEKLKNRKGLARRPQWNQHECHSLGTKRASLEGLGIRGLMIFCARATRKLRRCSFDARTMGPIQAASKDYSWLVMILFRALLSASSNNSAFRVTTLTESDQGK